MTRDRHAAPSTAALTTSVFWAGMVVGRFSLGIISRLMRGNLRWMVVVFAGTSLALQIMFRHTTDLQLLLVLIAAIGVVSGPIYPSGLLTLTRTIPASIHVRAVALTCSVGQLGGAGAPFLTGVIAQTSGIRRLFDVVLGLTVAELAVWLWFSRPRKDKEIVPDDDEEEE
jgi:fucose permease